MTEKTKIDIKEVLKLHKKWIEVEKGGEHADLQAANLCNADLQGADLDFSVLYFSCLSFSPKTDEKQRIQLAYHLLSWIANADNATEFEKGLYEHAKDYARRFHRKDVERLK